MKSKNLLIFDLLILFIISLNHLFYSNFDSSWTSGVHSLHKLNSLFYLLIFALFLLLAVVYFIDVEREIFNINFFKLIIILKFILNNNLILFLNNRFIFIYFDNKSAWFKIFKSFRYIFNYLKFLLITCGILWNSYIRI